MTEYSYPTYNDIYKRALADNRNEKLISLQSARVIQFINEAQSCLCDRTQVLGSQDLLLNVDQEDYEFAYTKSITGTGTISSSDRDVTGVGTAFTTELAVGSVIRATIATTVYLRRVAVIDSDTELELDRAFPSNLPALTALTFDRRPSEISVDFYKIQEAEYIDENNVSRPIVIADLSHLLAVRQKEQYDVRSIEEKPYMIAEHVSGQVKRLKIYPLVAEARTITIYGLMKFQPRVHNDEDIGASVQLAEMYEKMIRSYFLYLAYESFGMGDDAQRHLIFFEKYIQEARNHVERKPYIRMVYR